MPLGRDAGQVALLLFEGTKRCRTFASKIFREWKNEIFRRREIFGVVRGYTSKAFGARKSSNKFGSSLVYALFDMLTQLILR